MKLSIMKMGLTAIVAGGLMSATVQAGDQWWPADVNAYEPSCTGGSAECWADERNNPAALPVTQYVPLMPEEVDSKHHICVSFPHLKDSYWVGVGYGIISEAKRLGQKVTLVEAGGYTNLERQLSQIEDCVSNGADALIISAISNTGNTKQVDEIRAKGIPVVDLVNGINTQIDAKSLESWYLLGYMACGWAAEQHPAGSGKATLAWFPGPPGAGWSVAGDNGCHDSVKGSDVEIVATKWGDTGKGIQMKLVEDVVASQTRSGKTDLDYIVGAAPTVEAAYSVVRDKGLKDQTKLVAYYYTQGMQIMLEKGRMAMAPSDQTVLQGQIAIDQAVRLLEGKAPSTGGSPEYNNPDRITEHVQPVPIVFTSANAKKTDTRSSLAPKGWKPKFSVD